MTLLYYAGYYAFDVYLFFNSDLQCSSLISILWGVTALGDDRRYFSYYKALSVLEKVPFKITSVDQIKGLPAIGKSLRDSVSVIWLFIACSSSSRCCILNDFSTDMCSQQKMYLISLWISFTMLTMYTYRFTRLWTLQSCLMWLQWWQIQEILGTGKLSKLEHLKNDDKVLKDLSTRLL